MSHKLFSGFPDLCLVVMVAALTACASPAGVSPTEPSVSDLAATIVAATMQALPTNGPTPEPQPSDESIVVAFVKAGDIHIWDSVTLFLGTLDHTTVPIIAWPLEEWVTPQK